MPEYVLLVFTAQIVAIFSVLLLGLGFLKSDPKAASARMSFLLSLCIVSYLLVSMSLSSIPAPFRLDPGAWWLLLVLASTATPGVFMLYCFYYFEDHGKPARSLLALLFFGLSLTLVSFQFPAVYSWLASVAGEGVATGVLQTLPNLIQLLFAALAMYWVARGWREDLVESRRLLRSIVVSIQSVVILVVLLMENYVMVNAQEQYGLLRNIIHYVISIFSFGALLAVLNFNYGSVEKVLNKVVSTEDDHSIDEALASEVVKLNRVLKQDKIYREHGLTIAKLAAVLELPEYRLRALINKHLDYRNFNALLHEYRIEDACQMLTQAGDKHLPILTIALTVGYQSITPFNNAFKQLKGVTPTEFRKREH